jgi:hypothetical protein
VKLNELKPVGSVFLIPLRSGRLMPFQVVRTLENGAISVCGLIGRTYFTPVEAQAASAGWRSDDVVAKISIPTQNITNHDGARWEGLGIFPVLSHGAGLSLRSKIAEVIRRKLRVEKEAGLSFCSVGVLYELANASVGEAAWDMMAEPTYFEQFLTDPKSPLIRRRLKKDMS